MDSRFGSPIRSRLIVLWLSGLFVAWQCWCNAQNVLLTWTASTSPNIVGYNIYYGTSSNAYTNEISAGNISSLTISNLAVGTTYYFAASAVNSSGIQSALSSPTSYTVTLPVPLLTITNVTSGMHVTNSTFKVMGVATDSVTVAGVYCSFNGGAYTPVSLLGIQWNMTLALMYGSNTLSAYAVDINGTSSSTNTVSIDYTPMAVMTVQTTGQGAISPNYNGSWLQVGATYSMTATPANGFAFNGWTSSTNGNFSAYTNGSTVQFAMFSNLVMQANFLDTSKPFVSITNITPGMHVTNGFTAMGLATDNVAVTSVQYSLNGGAFVPAAIAGNVWSSALLSLNLGSNSLAIYSTDGSGNVSTTSTVIFDYVVSAPLTVQTNGNGSVNPNYNGSSLQVGAVYTMTATAAKGFEFGSWTGSTNGTFTTYTNGPTVQFTMFSNLVMQANFTDTNNPFINITNITSGMHITNGYTAMGLATDNVAVASVQYSLNGGAFVPAAVVGNVWSSAPLSLNLGSNSLAVYATDINGNVSATGSVLFDYVVSAILTVQTNGNGSVNPNYNGTSLQIGANYTMTATAAKGFAFSSWTGSTNGAFTTYTNGPIVQFRMFSNLVMQANFTDTNNPFVSITNITSGMHVTNGFTAMGLATDNVAVASVQYSLNGGPFVPANIAGNVWSSAPLSLNIGSNSLAVYSTDSSSNVSATSTVLFDYVVSATLTVQTNGEGIINPNYNGSVLNIGAPYTMTATPINGFAFSSWTGSTNGNFTTYTNGPTVQFTMFSNLVMQANFTDTNNPFVSITNITPGMQVNTETFTAMGLATDNVAVASVQYSLNGGPFAPASITGNSWMSALLSLNPGTNTLAVYATDTNSNVSATATVSFNYIVSATLTVQANGEGFVTPNYNGSLLQVGAVYSMTAMPTNGFAFSSWTGSTNGTFTPYTSSPTVQFTMLPNLVMQANFVDTNNPVVSITNITPGMQVTTETFTAMGLATDNVAVASVQYSLNGGPFVPAAITNNSWSSAQLTLNPGTNTLAVYATDTSGNVSATATAGVNYVVSAALTVQTNGNGFVSPNYNGALLQIGGMYTMTATPTNGFAFSSWTGSTNGIFTSYTNGPTVQFEMFSNLVMQANFVDTNAPSISIANVTSGMQVSVANLTVFGVATDNVGISNVFYSLNGAPFAPTPIKMNGNVWSVPLSFVPGTNTIAVYAVDPSGNVSATAVGAVDYVVLSKVTVQSTGPGYINPNYNGLYLQIGTTYSMTAHGTNGFGIGAWTGSTNGVQVFSSNVNTLQFTMLPNLVVQANFVDTNAPFISIDNIPPALAVSNADFTVEGTATDNVAVASVQYSLNGGPFAPAAITNNTWGADLALMGGTNTIAAYAMDAAGNVSATNTASIAYVQVSMLTVKASGKGSINNNLNGQKLRVGQKYSMSATASSGFVFTNWTSATNGTYAYYTNSPTVQFTMFTNLVLQANFQDTGKPMLAITNVTSGMLWTNPTYTVMGVATDDQTIASVNFSFNNSPYAPAITNGIQWNSGLLSLIPGTNVFSVYAQATNGNFSVTDTVRLVYALSNLLTVVTNGKGSVSPNLNHMSLRIGQNYSMNASAGSGYIFTNWSAGPVGGPLTIYTNKTTAIFEMSGDLEMQANFVDTLKPYLKITNAVSGMVLWTNSSFTVMGVATDDQAVASVNFSFNHGAYAPAITNGIQWNSGSLSLIPGTNIFSVYAQATNGNLSPTSTVDIVYAVSNLLTVVTNGKGSFSPNLNQKSLRIGQNYSMTASAGSGYMFTNWSCGVVGGPLTTYTNKANAIFEMSSNLEMQANFVDTLKPYLKITNATSGMLWTNPTFTVMGVATDDQQLASVNFSINHSAYAPATTNGIQWDTGPLTLMAGTNIFSVYAQATNGNVSATNTIALVYAVTNQLLIDSTGKGTLSPNYSNAWLRVGMNYSMTAHPASGFMFTNWVVSTNFIGGVTSNNPTLLFMMATNLTIQANFVETARPTLAISSPGNNAREPGSVTVSGTAKDAWGVSTVVYELNGAPWTNAVTTNVFTNWTASVSLNPGTNILKAFAINLGGLYSTTNTLSIISTNTAAATVQFALSSPQPTAHGFNINMKLTPGLSGRIQVSTNLVDWEVLTNFTETDGAISVYDPNTTSPQRFYRAVVP